MQGPPHVPGGIAMEVDGDEREEHIRSAAALDLFGSDEDD